MIVKINGQELAGAQYPAYVAEYDQGFAVERKIDKAMRRWAIPAAAAIGALKASTMTASAAAGKAIMVMAPAAIATASSFGSRMMPLINMVQDIALPVGIIVATWGLIEIMIGNPSGKQKIKYAVIGYCGIFLIPTLFYQIHDSFRGAVG